MSDRRQKILIVEDDQNLRLSLTELFRHLGYIVVTARDGDEGYMQAVAHQPDLIITDLNMPVLDGVELARLIRREQGKIGGIPIIALSANISGYHLPDKMTSGIDRFVDKSGGDGHHLITAVKNMLDGPSLSVHNQIEHHA